MNLERLAAICSAPYRDQFGALRAVCCGQPVYLAPGRRTARPWGQGLPERPCRCGKAAA